MSSFQLISHHLFVAAVNDRSWMTNVPGWTEPPTDTPEVCAREVPIEVLDHGRPLVRPASRPFGILRPVVST